MMTIRSAKHVSCVNLTANLNVLNPVRASAEIFVRSRTTFFVNFIPFGSVLAVNELVEKLRLITCNVNSLKC